MQLPLASLVWQSELTQPVVLGSSVLASSLALGKPPSFRYSGSPPGLPLRIIRSGLKSPVSWTHPGLHQNLQGRGEASGVYRIRGQSQRAAQAGNPCASTDGNLTKGELWCWKKQAPCSSGAKNPAESIGRVKVMVRGGLNVEDGAWGPGRGCPGRGCSPWPPAAAPAAAGSHGCRHTLRSHFGRQGWSILMAA